MYWKRGKPCALYDWTVCLRVCFLCFLCRFHFFTQIQIVFSVWFGLFFSVRSILNSLQHLFHITKHVCLLPHFALTRPYLVVMKELDISSLFFSTQTPSMSRLDGRVSLSYACHSCSAVHRRLYVRSDRQLVCFRSSFCSALFPFVLMFCLFGLLCQFATEARL